MEISEYTSELETRSIVQKLNFTEIILHRLPPISKNTVEARRFQVFTPRFQGLFRNSGIQSGASHAEANDRTCYLNQNSKHLSFKIKIKTPSCFLLPLTAQHRCISARYRKKAHMLRPGLWIS